VDEDVQQVPQPERVAAARDVRRGALRQEVGNLATFTPDRHDRDATAPRFVLDLMTPFPLHPFRRHAGASQQDEDEIHFLQPLLDALREILADADLPLVEPDVQSGRPEVVGEPARQRLVDAAVREEHLQGSTPSAGQLHGGTSGRGE
jgi:hypothetical protein